MKWLLIPMLGLAMIAPANLTQTSDPYKVEPILTMLEEIDVANQILPLVMDREQLNKMLLQIEKCRGNVLAQEKKEADALKRAEAEIKKAHEEALKGIVPKDEFLTKMNKMFADFTNDRNGVKLANALLLRDAMKEILNPGQIKAAVGVVDKVYNEQTRQWEPGDTERKLIFFATQVLMNEDTYQFLVKYKRSL
ncbi:MAG: hypothetical protein AKCLJLPJ_00479 [Fimbriimonadales bacterium]|nr:MAG: hypothetical protein EDM73_03510 [Armatimonadota bacterium]MBV6502433.1 hypothetical protein [Fimbriimonadales bacterium]MCE7898726.1 hypothetical protein [Armatimonadetes bacterium ATM1]MDL1928777.1 hypothetical protein [Fimbriimonadia bacterium ATM]MBC6968436.1 hypothetical protein [Armatimonadota bacterium]